jgi:hypothetical protein
MWRTIGFALAAACVLTAMTLGADPLLMSLAIFGAWLFLTLEIAYSTSSKLQKIAQSVVAAAILTAAGGLLYWHALRSVPSPDASSQAPPIATVPVPPPTPQQMPRHFLLSLFMTDHDNITGMFSGPSAAGINEYSNLLGKLFFRVVYDAESRSKFILIYIPANENTAKMAYDLPVVIGAYLASDATNSPIRNFQGQAQGSSNAERFVDYPFSGRVYVYCESPIGAEDIGGVTKAFRDAVMAVQIMGSDAALGVWANIQLGIVKPLPYFEIDGNKICIKGPLAEPLPIPAQLCKPEKK